MTAVFDDDYVKRLQGVNVKSFGSKLEAVDAIREDMRRFREDNGCDRLVMVWCASTEKFITEGDVHQDIESFVGGLRESDPSIAPSMVYAYAALLEGVPFVNGAPNLSTDVTALEKMARDEGVPVCGKDLKTGQTLVKTVIGPMLKARMLGMDGWFSTNILGNRDGEVLDEPENFRTKEESKLGVLEHILQPDMYPELYSDAYHKVRINYYPPRGDAKEGWDNIDLFGWLHHRMQLKINFLCSDSILAAPLVLDLILFMDLARRAGMSGIQEWLSFYFKSPAAPAERRPRSTTCSFSRPSSRTPFAGSWARTRSRTSAWNTTMSRCPRPFPSPAPHPTPRPRAGPRAYLKRSPACHALCRRDALPPSETGAQLPPDGEVVKVQDLPNNPQSTPSTPFPHKAVAPATATDPLPCRTIRPTIPATYPHKETFARPSYPHPPTVMPPPPSVIPAKGDLCVTSRRGRGWEREADPASLEPHPGFPPSRE